MFSEIVAGLSFSRDIHPLQEAIHEAGATCPNMASLAVILTSIGLSYAQSFAERCQNLQISIPNVQVNVLEYVANGTNLTFPYDVCTHTTPTEYMLTHLSGPIMHAWIPNGLRRGHLSCRNARSYI